MSIAPELIAGRRVNCFDGAMKIGCRIETARQRRGWSQTRLAGEVGVQQSRVSRWERDEGLPTVPQIVALAHALGSSVDELLGVPREPAASPESQLSEDDRVILIIARDLGPTEARRRLLRPPGPVFELLEPQAEPSPNPKPGSHRTGTR